MSKNPLLQTLITMTGQDNVITVHRPFVEFTGSLEAAMMLSQLLYWTPKSSMGGWIAKSDKDWKQELCLTRYSHRKATDALIAMGIVETQVKKFKGSPTVHYLILWEALENEWVSWLRSSENERTESLKTNDPSSENRRSLTETTPKTTTKIEEDPALATISKAYTDEIAPITVMIAEDLREASTAYPLKWVLDAIHEAAVQNKRGWKYVLAILARWKAQGNQEAMKPMSRTINTTSSKQEQNLANIQSWLAKQENPNGN